MDQAGKNAGDAISITQVKEKFSSTAQAWVCGL
jgi:hypothetical protein